MRCNASKPHAKAVLRCYYGGTFNAPYAAHVRAKAFCIERGKIFLYRRFAVIEIVIAKGYKVVPAYVHKRSYCFAAVLCLAVKIICERAALQNVPAVYYKRIAILFEAGNAVGKSRGYAAARGVVDG